MQYLKKLATISIITLAMTIGLLAQNNNSELDTMQIADNMKFQNGVEFMKINDYNRALNEFNEYLEIYIHGIHRGNAYREIAKIHISNFDFQRAVKAYKSIYQEYSYTDEGIDAYFEAGICYKKMGYNNKATEIFQYIAKEHPGTNAAYNAEIQLELIKIISPEK